MPRSQGTSRKGKPSRHDQASGLGRALTKGRVAVRRDPRKIGTPGYVMPSHIGTTADPTNDANNDPNAQHNAQQQQQHPRSVLEVPDLQDFLEQADLAQTEFVSIREGLVVLDSTANAAAGTNAGMGGSLRKHNGTAQPDNFQSVELSVPRRPAWNEHTTKAELDQLERNAFYEWRRGIAVYEAALYNNQGHTVYTSVEGGVGPTTTAAASASITTTTPFERNLDVWRQLWRVLERSACLVQIVDARQPLFYLSTDLRRYASELPQQSIRVDTNDDADMDVDPSDTTPKIGKPMMVLVNKSDYLTPWQRSMWKETLRELGWEHVVFFSAVKEQAVLDEAAKREAAAIMAELKQNEMLSTNDVDNNDDDDDDDDWEDETDDDESTDSTPEAETGPEHVDVDAAAGITPLDGDADAHAPTTLTASTETENADIAEQEAQANAPLLNRRELIEYMLSFAKQHGCRPDPRYDNRIQFGMVGFPNVGKSSVINVLVGSSRHAHGLARVAVAAQPGKTKHFQTLLLPDLDGSGGVGASELMLCDCPGLVFPSLVSQTADLIAAGVYPIAQMRDYWPVMHLICERIPRDIFNAQYGLQLPVPGRHELREQQQQQDLSNEQYEALTMHTSATTLLNTFCIARSLLASFSGVPDHARAARRIVKDYATGNLLYCHAPPSVPSSVWPVTNTNENAETSSAPDNSFWQMWNRETRRTALAQTKRLRDQAATLSLPAPGTAAEAAGSNVEGASADSVSQAAASAAENAIDRDLLEMMGASAPFQNATTALDKSHKKSQKKAGATAKSKWGKKDRKNRNKDPYGCHSTPDGALYEEAVAAVHQTTLSSGVVVNGKHRQAAGYTRPVTFPSAPKPAAPVKP